MYLPRSQRAGETAGPGPSSQECLLRAQLCSLGPRVKAMTHPLQHGRWQNRIASAMGMGETSLAAGDGPWYSCLVLPQTIRQNCCGSQGGICIHVLSSMMPEGKNTTWYIPTCSVLKREAITTRVTNMDEP
jgi:hypothetical protein